MRRSLLPSLGELCAFECAARHGSFTRAAEELALTQSAVSRQVRQLEDRLGVTLLPRCLIDDDLTTGRLEVLFAQSLLSDSSYYRMVPEVKAAQPAVTHVRDWLIAQARGT